MENTDRKKAVYITGLLVLSVTVAIASTVLLFTYRPEDKRNAAGYFFENGKFVFQNDNLYLCTPEK
jgi:hypothetical protein